MLLELVVQFERLNPLPGAEDKTNGKAAGEPHLHTTSKQKTDLDKSCYSLLCMNAENY